MSDERGTAPREDPLIVWDRQWRERAAKWEQTANEERARADTAERQLAAAVDALDSADLLADAIFEGVTQRTLESIARQYRGARQHGQ